jgi:uncharacterized protein (DUF1501 family)
MSCSEARAVTRRAFFGGGAASLALWSLMPRTAMAGTRDPRLLVVVLRGGLDGLAAVAPVGDPDYARLRSGIALPTAGEDAGLALDGFFALNAAMPSLHALYGKREALILHAVHTPYRARSHFDGQDVLESGLPGVGRIEDGWLNRALLQLPSAGNANPRGLSIGAVVPLMMRGRAPALSWIPKVNGAPLRESTIARLMDLYAETDPALGKAFAEGMEISRVADAGAAAAPPPAPSQPSAQPQAPAQAPPAARVNREFTDAAEAAARFLSTPEGPRIGVLSYNGWDTHANEGPLKGQLALRLGGLDAAIHALESGMGPAWKDTIIVVVTEFGRTARVNGTQGTDHGMATVAFLVGGCVKGGRVLADWPGLREAALYEGRDLAPTRDLRAVLKGVLRDHLGIPDGALGASIFPDSGSARAVGGLLA